MASTEVTYLNLKEWVRDNRWHGLTKIDDRQVIDAIKAGLKHAAKARLWRFLHRSFRIQTVPPVALTGVTVVDGDATLTTAGTPFTTAHVGQYILLTGDSVYYRIASRTNSNTVELDNPYHGSNGTTGQILTAFYDLPDDFRSLQEFTDLDHTSNPLDVSWRDLIALQTSAVGAGTPIHYAITTDPTGTADQIEFHPPPSTTVHQYQVDYVRWPNIPALDADYIDWPDSEMDLLKAACLYKLSFGIKDSQFKQDAFAGWMVALREATAMDKVSRKARQLGSGGSSGVRRNLNRRGYYTDGPRNWS